MFDTVLLIFGVIGIALTVVPAARVGKKIVEVGKLWKRIVPELLTWWVHVELMQVKAVGQVVKSSVNLVAKLASQVGPAPGVKGKLMAGIRAMLVGFMCLVIMPKLLAKMFISAQVAKVQGLRETANVLVEWTPRLLAAQRTLAAMQKSTGANTSWWWPHVKL